MDGEVFFLKKKKTKQKKEREKNKKFQLLNESWMQ
jgi:hypothetical protein